MLERLGAPDDLVEVALAPARPLQPAALKRIRRQAMARAGVQAAAGRGERRAVGEAIAALVAAAALIVVPPVPAHAQWPRGRASLPGTTSARASLPGTVRWR